MRASREQEAQPRVKALKRSFQGAGTGDAGALGPKPLAHVPKGHQSMVAAVFRTIFAQPDAVSVESTWDSMRDQLAERFPKNRPTADGRAKTEVLAITSTGHWTKIWSTNRLERVNKEIKRRARVVGIFPNQPR